MTPNDSKALKVWEEDLKNPRIAKMIRDEWISICERPSDIAVFDSEEILSNRIKLKKVGKDQFVLIENVSVGRVFQLANDKWNYVFGKYSPSMNFDSKNMAINALDFIVEFNVIVTELFINTPIKSKSAVIKDDKGNITGVSMSDEMLPA